MEINTYRVTKILEDTHSHPWSARVWLENETRSKFFVNEQEAERWALDVIRENSEEPTIALRKTIPISSDALYVTDQLHDFILLSEAERPQLECVYENGRFCLHLEGARYMTKEEYDEFYSSDGLFDDA